jgi:hypothetical protein
MGEPRVRPPAWFPWGEHRAVRKHERGDGKVEVPCPELDEAAWAASPISTIIRPRLEVGTLDMLSTGPVTSRSAGRSG